MKLNITGKLIKISERMQKTETFTVRFFAIETDGQYPQPVKFQLVNDRCDLIDPIKEGEEITVWFDIRGNEWNGKIINNLNAWKIDRHVATATVAPPSNVPAPEEDDDMPF